MARKKHVDGVEPSERSPLLRELEPTPTNDDSPKQQPIANYSTATTGTHKTDGILSDTIPGPNGVTAGEPGAEAGATGEDTTISAEDLERQTSIEGRLQQYQGDSELRSRMKVVFPALAIGVFLGAADQTIIVSSYTKIGSDLGALNKTSWIAAAYYLTLTSFQPLYGKLSDIFSRKACLLFAYVIFGLGCLFCGLARTIDELILARALAGIGGGGMTTVVSILLSDAIPLKERGTWQGFVNIIFASGASAGAPLGGLLADSIGWRWSFLAQTPLCVVAFIAVALLLKLPDRHDVTGKTHWREKLQRIDVIGALVLVSAVFCLLLGLDRGSNVSWRDRWAFVPLSISFPLFALFVFVEMKVAAEPFAPGHIIFKRSLFATYLCNFFSFAGMMAVLFYVPLYYQAVHGFSTTQAGLLLLPGIACSVSGSLFGGFYMQRTGKYYYITATAYINLVIGLVVILLCSGLVVTSVVGIVLGMCLCSFSNGVGVTTTLIALISNASREDQAVVTACSYLFRSLGSTTGVSLSATAANQTLRSSLQKGLGSGKKAEKIILEVRKSLDYLKTLDPKTRALVRNSYALSTRAAFILEIGLLLGSASATWLIREKPLSR